MYLFPILFAIILHPLCTRLSAGSYSSHDLPTRDSCFDPLDFGDCETFSTSSDTSYYKHQVKKTSRYYYNTLNFHCEKFPYQGKGGNRNNFHTYEECMQTCYNKDEIIKAIKTARQNKKCYFRNKLYAVGETINSFDVHLESACIGCVCIDGKPNPKLQCFIQDCARPAPDCENIKGFDCCARPRPSVCCPRLGFTQACNETQPKCQYGTKETNVVPVDEIYMMSSYPCLKFQCIDENPGCFSATTARPVGCGLNSQLSLQDQLLSCDPVYSFGPDGAPDVCCPTKWINCNAAFTTSADID